MALASAQCPGQTGLPAQGAGCRNSTHILCNRDTPAAGLGPSPAATASQPTEQGSSQWDTHPGDPQATQQASGSQNTACTRPETQGLCLQVNARRPSCFRCFRERMRLAEVNKGLG